MKTLHREPWRRGQICGYQTEYGVVPGRTVQCGEFKAPGRYFCQEHHEWMFLDGPIHMAEGNAVGLELTQDGEDGWYVINVAGELVAGPGSRDALVFAYGFSLRWEGAKGQPIAPTDEELRAFEADVPRETKGT